MILPNHSHFPPVSEKKETRTLLIFNFHKQKMKKKNIFSDLEVYRVDDIIEKSRFGRSMDLSLYRNNKKIKQKFYEYILSELCKAIKGL